MDLSWLMTEALAQPMPRHRAIYQGLRAAILDGRLPAGTRLPASRQLARDFRIARNTVLQVYEQLTAEACVVADRQGTRVADLPVTVSADTPSRRPLSRRAQSLPLPLTTATSEFVPFALGGIDFQSFPMRAWRAALDRAWRSARPAQLGYAEAGGEMVLREAVAEHLRLFRGLPVSPAQVLMTSGTQAALDLVARLFADPGDTVWVENPGYVSGRAALTLAGLRLRPVPVDREGLAPCAEDWFRYPPNLVALTPSHQFPSGSVLSLPRRLELIAAAQAYGAWLIEDDYGSEFFDAPPLPALFGLRPQAPVLYVGGFSKTLYPALRLGYLVVPLEYSEAVAAAARQATRLGQGIEQIALADFMRRGDYIRHLRRSRQLVRERRAAMRNALGILREGYLVEGAGAGQHLLLRLPDSMDDRKVVAAAAEAGLECRALSSFCDPPDGRMGLLLGYGAIPAARIPEAVRRLARVLEVCATGSGASRRRQ